MIPINWTCPYCGAEETDLYEETAIPYCETCGKDCHWEDILTPDEMAAANEKMIEQEQAAENK